MEENKLVPRETNEIAFGDEIYGVKVELSKRKRKRKHRFKKAITLLILMCFAVIAIRNFNSISTFISSLFSSEESQGDQSSTVSSTMDTPSSSPQESEGEQSEKDEYEFHFIDTSPTEFKIIDYNQNTINISNLNYELPTSNDVYAFYGDNAPLVLIVNFSPNECYSSGQGYSYTSEFYSDTNNVSQLGEQICLNLNSLGIGAIHLKMDTGNLSLVDYQSKYAYEIEKVLESNPSILYVLDVSRDVKIDENMDMVCEKTEVSGVKLPTVRFVCGTNNGTVSEAQEKSFYVSLKLAEQMNETAVLASSLEISPLDLNQRFSIPCIRVELGSYACSFESASLTADFFALSLYSFINRN